MAATPIHQQLRTRRQELKLTQRQLADRAGISHSHVAMIELGTVKVQVVTAAKLAHAMGMEMQLVPLTEGSTT